MSGAQRTEVKSASASANGTVPYDAGMAEGDSVAAEGATPAAEPLGFVDGIWRAVRPMVVAVVSGGIAGFFAGGLGSRTVMKIIALSDPSTDGANTDANVPVGDFTDATLDLLAFGTFLGLVAGPVYLGLRRWLPFGRKWHGLTFGVFTMFTFGLAIFDDNNADFQMFEPILFAIALFMSLHLLNGVILAYLVDRFAPEPEYKPSQRVPLIVRGVMSVAVLAGAVLMTAVTIGMVEDEGTCLSAAGEGNGCAVFTPED